MVGTEQQEIERPALLEGGQIARSYIEAINAGDVEGAVALWAPGGRETIHGVEDATAPDGVRAFLGGLRASIPDLRFEILDVTAEGSHAHVRSRMTGTFAGPAAWDGIEPNGARLDLEVIDCLEVHDGLITANDAYSDGMTIARQIGVMAPAGSPTERRMTKAFNVGTRLKAGSVGTPEKVADGVWLMRGGFPSKTMNVFLIEDSDGIVVFDAGIRAMTNAVARQGALMGGITKLVLGHAHPDHRGIAAGLGVPVLCHPDDRPDAEGDGGAHYFRFSELNPLGRRMFPTLLRIWDGGPVDIAGTVQEGDEVAGFRVVHLPGHAPGLIGLWREEDRLALVSDLFYTLDPQTGRPGPPRVPHRAFNADTEQARASMRKLAAMGPAAAWPGHADPLVGDVRSQLEHAAATT